MNNKSKTGKHNKESDIKIAVLGASLVGKSALTYRFINNMFPTDHDTTIEDTYRFKLNIDGKDFLLGKNLLN
jgi:GTPase SAR1 family protein